MTSNRQKKRQHLTIDEQVAVVTDYNTVTIVNGKETKLKVREICEKHNISPTTLYKIINQQA